MDALQARSDHSARSLRRLAAAAALAAAFALLPAAAGLAESSEAVPEWEREMAVEVTCLDWQKVRRCADEDGALQYECAASSPFARFWAMLRGEDRREDDEVQVVKVRKAPGEPETEERIDPEDAAAMERSAREQVRQASQRAEAEAGSGDRRADAAAGGDERRVVKRVVREGDLPRCQENG